MATATGTINGATLMRSNVSTGARKTWLVSANFPAYTGSSDSATLTGVGAYISAHCRNGKTQTLRGAQSAGAGLDTNAQAVYVGACTVSTDALTFNLSDNTGTELTSSTASIGVELMVFLDES